MHREALHQHLVNIRLLPGRKYIKGPNTITLPSRFYTTNSPTNDPSTDKKKKGYFTRAKEMAIFYKNGIKQLFANYRLSAALTRKFRKEFSDLNRREIHLIRTTRRDMKRLLPFGLILFIIPEAIPFAIFFAPGLIPSTCILPAQLEKRRRKIHETRQAICDKLLATSDAIARKDFQDISSVIRLSRQIGDKLYLAKFPKQLLVDLCRFMGLSRFGTKNMLKRRLENRLDYLFGDDMLIAKEGIKTLTLDELKQASEERGIKSVDIPDNQLRLALQHWIALHLHQNPEIQDELLLFSRTFLYNAKYQQRNSDVIAIT
ncbi:1646_t:CDS:2 [Paraglomus brasilianum]|uniref:1646_t:CDS:1 n=1 Tax=Paraglomus brasilianum TaxID=144538 RepID=A0A9N8VR36_9GLOM|nr:1646_t:CDS:2 [Paraglomus brasilianum]